MQRIRKSKYPMFYNKPAISLFKEIKKGFEIKLLKGISKRYQEETIKISYSNKFIEFAFNEGFYPNVSSSLARTKKFFKAVHAKDEQREYILERLSIDIYSFTSLEGIIGAIRSKSFGLKYSYFKLLIPIQGKLDFHWTIELLKFSSDRVSVSKVGTKIDFNGETISILCESDKEENDYLIIESTKKQSYEQFSEKAHLVKIAIGYLTGYYVGNEGCYFSYSNKKREQITGFKFRFLRPEMVTLANPVYSNPYGRIRNKRIAEKYLKQDILKPVSQKSLSCLFSKMIEHEGLTSTLLLILESSESSLIVRPNGYAIALETLSDIILGTKKEKLAPITNKTASKQFRKELGEVLAKHSQSPHFKDIATLQGRIDQINQMTNKERLKAPFRALNIELSEEDLKVIASRNDFLHGRVPDFKNLGENRSIEQKDSDLHYASERLYTLLNVLILKFVGFDNYVLNYPKIYEKGTGYSLNEDYYRKV